MKQSIVTTDPELTGTDYIAKIGTNNARLRKGKFHYPFSVHDGIPARTMLIKIKYKENSKSWMKKKGLVFSSKRSWVLERKGDPWFDKTYLTSKQKMDKLILDGMELK
jgi:hypothetical protein